MKKDLVEQAPPPSDSEERLKPRKINRTCPVDPKCQSIKPDGTCNPSHCLKTFRKDKRVNGGSASD